MKKLKKNYTRDEIIREIIYSNFDMNKLPHNFRNKAFILELIKVHKVYLSFTIVFQLGIRIDYEIMLAHYELYTSMFERMEAPRVTIESTFCRVADKKEREKAIMILELLT